MIIGSLSALNLIPLTKAYYLVYHFDTDRDAYRALWSQCENENEEAMKDDEYLYQGFLYELGNHEFCITYDPSDTLDCFGLSIDVFDDNERISRIFKKARTDYLDSCEHWN